MGRTNLFEEADIVIQKLPSDMGIHRNPRKGTLNAPDRILEGLAFDRPVLVDSVFPDEFDLEETHERIYNNTSELAEYDRPIVSIGGDHSVSYPVIKALKQENPEMKLVWLDAHLDLKEKVDGHISHDVVVRQLIEEGIFGAEEIYFVGVTGIDHDEEGFLEDHDFNFYRADKVSQLLEDYDSDRPCYLSVDIDALREETAPGTGYTDGQLSLEQVEKVVGKLRPRHADLVEVAPSLDRDGRTVKAGQDLLQNIIGNLDIS